MTTTKDRDSFVASNHPMTLDDVSLNMTLTIPITRSLSKSTPRDPTIKVPPPPRAQVIDRAEDDISVQPSALLQELEVEHIEDPRILLAHHTKQSSCSPIDQLPHEILDAIISHVGGQLGSPSLARRSDRIRNWNAILRHPRRKTVSDLALVSPIWRRLVQERIFRHIKIQGTQAALIDLGDFFLKHTHLQTYVRHLQVIVPIWETKKGATCQRHAPDLSSIDRMVLTVTSFQPITRGTLDDQQHEVSHIFRPASKNATLSEIFASAQVLFPELHALTVEAGHCKRPPQIKYFHSQAQRSLRSQAFSSYGASPKHYFSIPSPPGPSLPILPSVKVLILKGAWNIVRQAPELKKINNALPNIQELHCTYHTPKTDAYTTMCLSLRPRSFPQTIRHLNICLEGLYAKNPSSLAKWRKVYPDHHICRAIGSLAPQLESFTYTGRVCGTIFSTAHKEAENLRSGTTRLSRIDIVVQNICRDVNANNDGTGIHNWSFIQGFELLIIQAMRVLASYIDINFMRIRFIDLDSPDPLLNPSFHLEGNHAWGFWSEEILNLLYAARPDVNFEGAHLSGAYPEVDSPGGRRSHSVEYYCAIAQSLGRGIL